MLDMAYTTYMIDVVDILYVMDMARVVDMMDSLDSTDTIMDIDITLYVCASEKRVKESVRASVAAAIVVVEGQFVVTWGPCSVHVPLQLSS